MKTQGTRQWMRMCLALFAVGGLTAGAWAADEKRLTVAVTEADVEAIVKVVGGNQVETFSLFRGCILRKDLAVEPQSKSRLVKADTIVWTGFLRESEAINTVMRESSPSSPGPMTPIVHWIDVSPGTFRTNVPFTTCEGYADPLYAAGDPFFWLNPENGAVMARNVAKGLSKLQPGKESYFHANATAFGKALASDIARWREALKPLHGWRIFSAQCGWQNFSSMGGPKFLVCKATPGQLPNPKLLLDHVKQMKATVILVDPNTPPEYVAAFKEHSGVKVIEVPSSIEGLQGDKSYSSLFENLVKTLQGAVQH